MELMVSPPALASPSHLRLGRLRLRRNEEKSVVLSGCLTEPRTFAPEESPPRTCRAPAPVRRRSRR